MTLIGRLKIMTLSASAVVVFMLISTVGCSSVEKPKEIDSSATSAGVSTDLIAKARAWYTAVSSRDTNTMRSLVAEDYIDRNYTMFQAKSRENLMHDYRGLIEVFPNLSIEPYHVIQGGNVVAIAATARGTQAQDFLEIKSKNKPFKIDLFEFLRFNEKGEIAERWGASEADKLREQLK